MDRERRTGEPPLVRPMGDEDLPAVLAIERDAYPRPPWTEAMFAEEIGRDDRCYLVASLGQDVVGFAGARAAGEDAEVLTVAVAPDRQGQGVGRALVSVLVDELAKRGATSVTLEVRTSNRAAQTLYRELGFVPVGRRPGYYQDGEDALIMWRAPTERKG